MTRLAEVAAQLRVSDVMSDVVVTVTPDDSVYAAWDLLVRGGFHHLPVVGTEGRCLSMLDDRLVAASLTPPFGLVRRSVADVMPPRVHCVLAGDELRHAAAIMAAERVTSVPVVDERGHLVGILTDSDVVAAVAGCR